MCDCREDIEAKLLARFIEQNPEARAHEARLNGYAMVFADGGAMKERGRMEIETTAVFPLKKGGEKAKTTKGSMIFGYCPFCGEKYA